MSLHHHSESTPQPQYDGNLTHGLTNRQGNGQPPGNGQTSSHGQTSSSVAPLERHETNRVAVDTVSVLNGNGAVEVVPKPVWDRELRELRFGDTVVKRFKWPAENQERVLDAFQENGWPTHIEDPLQQHPKICPKRRLHDTLKCLNRKQINGAIKFRGDGTGQGVLLEIVSKQD